MKQSTTKTIMKCVGATLAVCSAISMFEGTKSSSASTKKMVKKTAGKVADFVDAVATFM